MRLLSALSDLQDTTGFLSDEALRELARRERVPLYRLQGLVSFYPHFRTAPPPRVELLVCRDVSCWLAGAAECGTKPCRTMAGVEGVECREVSCLGRCDIAPAGLLNGSPVSLSELDAAPEAVSELASRVAASATTTFAPDHPCAAARVWRCDPYASASERYGLFRELLAGDRTEAAERVLGALRESGLRGMGGAAFPTAAKWELVRKQTRTPKYVICNADESEPGTFKDRVILTELPHLVIEGMLIASLVVGADRGILFIRHEYAAERRRFEQALKEWRSRDLGGSGPAVNSFRFELEVFVSPGGYILGEETALLEALEDRRGEPRNRPPFPATHGLNGLPTLINNVETLAMVPSLVRRGSAWWKSQGTGGRSGLKFISVSGHVNRPGVYEIPLGTTVRELIEQAGGTKGGRPLKAFAPGGASSRFLPAAMADVPLDFDALTQAGSSLGSGALIVVAEGTDMLALAANLVRFFRNESCGKCVPCRVGTQQAVALLERCLAGHAERSELDILRDLSETMALTSICGLGQVALNPILSVRQHWPEEAR
jgi:NADH:ubiquinone oxidoreductase subunit F (NADH-binding)/NADH:ubiquinone oxidoreductase subunit E